MRACGVYAESAVCACVCACVVYGECVCVCACVWRVCVWRDVVCGMLGVCAHVECMRRVLVCVVCVWCGVWRGVCGVCGCGVWVWCVEVCVECMCVCVCVCVRSVRVSVIKNRQVFPWDPLQSTPGDRLHTSTSLPWDCSPQGTDYTERPTPGTPPWGTRVCCLYVYIYIHDSICVSVYAYVRDCVVFQCTHMVVCMIDKPSPGTLLKASTQ